MRLVLMGILAVMIGHTARADEKKGEKIDAKKLVGKWAVPPLNDATLLEFTKDEKVKIKLFQNLEGTYKVDGNKLTLKLKVGRGEEEMVLTITNLTDAELVTKDKGGKEEKFERVEDERRLGIVRLADQSRITDVGYRGPLGRTTGGPDHGTASEGFCIFGRFVPEDGFEVCRAAFEAAYRGDEEYARAVELSGAPSVPSGRRGTRRSRPSADRISSTPTRPRPGSGRGRTRGSPRPPRRGASPATP